MKVNLPPVLLGTTGEMLCPKVGLTWRIPTAAISCHRYYGPNAETPPPHSQNTSHFCYSSYKKIQCLLRNLHHPHPPLQCPLGLPTWQLQVRCEAQLQRSLRNSNSNSNLWLFSLCCIGRHSPKESEWNRS